MEDILESVPYTDIVILGDSNSSVNIYNYGFILMNSLLQNFGITPCELLSETQRFTYVNEALNSSSSIDHCFLSEGLRAFIHTVSIIDSL